jgi:peptide chain release factor 1
MLIEKIDIVEKRYDEIYQLIGNPEVIADQKKYIELNKELKDLSKLVNKGRLY